MGRGTSRPGIAIAQAAEAIVITDGSGNIQYVNPAFTRLTGYTAEEAAGQNPRILKSESQDVAFYQKMWETIRAGRVWQGSLTNRRKDGTCYSEEMTITPVRDAQGRISSYIAIKQDVTNRKAGEDASSTCWPQSSNPPRTPSWFTLRRAGF